MSDKQRKREIWLLVLYAPISCVLIGLMSIVFRMAVPATGSRDPLEVFKAYALRLPDDFNILRWAALGLGWLILLLMIVSLRSRKPVVTVIQVRVIVLVLFIIVTLAVRIFGIALPLAPTSVSGPLAGGDSDRASNMLYLFVFMDLFLAAGASHLPLFKPLRHRLT